MTDRIDPEPTNQDGARERIGALLAALPEGTPFRPDDLLAEDPVLLPVFFGDAADLHVPIGGGYHVAIIHTPYLKRLPAGRRLAERWAEMQGRRIVENGSWTAHRMGLLRWEPMDGLGYLWDGPYCRFSMRRVTVTFTTAPDWILEDSPAGRLVRAVSGLPDRGAPEALARYLRDHPEAVRTLAAAADLAGSAMKQTAPTAPADPASDPASDIASDFASDHLAPAPAEARLAVRARRRQRATTPAERSPAEIEIFTAERIVTLVSEALASAATKVF